MNCNCHEKTNKKCGEDTHKGKEEQLAHLKKCKESFILKIKEIDEAIVKIEQS